jgi:ABC-type multidrug transport system fused ATPase/permease subunit
MENDILPKRNLPRDVFLHLLAIVTLYWSAVSFVTLVWQYVDYFFQDALNNSYYLSFTGPIRFAVASLIIVFPVFILVSWFLNRIYKREAQVRESKIRKWLIYFTLFAASLIIIGDLIAVINTFLGGEITVRFILKALSIIVVAAFVLGYYFDDVRKETPTKLAKPFAWVSIIIILATIIGAFFIVGSPTTARLINFDQQKVSDLQNIQSQVVNYWQRKQVLPALLADLNDPISSFMVPNDPQTGKPYEYSVQDVTKLSFELCATFNKAGNDQYASPAAPVSVPIGKVVQNWQHASGRVCFERTIDKQLYPPLNPPTTK